MIWEDLGDHSGINVKQKAILRGVESPYDELDFDPLKVENLRYGRLKICCYESR